MTEVESNTAFELRDDRVVTFGGAQETGAAAGDDAAENASHDAAEPSQVEPGAPSETTPRSQRRALRWGAIIGAAAIVAAVSVGVALANGGAFQPAADDASAPSASQQASEGSKAAEPATTAASENAEPADEQPESQAAATSEAASPAAPAEGSDGSTAGAATQSGSMGAPSSNAQSSAGGTGAAGGASSPSAPSSPGASGGASAGSEGGSAPSGGQQQETPQTPPAEEPAAQTVTAQVDSSAVGGSVSFSGTVEYREGMTVFDVLVETGLPYNAESSAFGIYVSAIGGLAEKDGGSQSGWKYSVNGEVVMVSASACTVRPGDVVKWFYTTVG